MRLLSTSAAPFAILAAMALAACGDKLDPTLPVPKDPNHFIVCGDGCGGGGGGGGGGGSPPPAPPAITGATAPSSLDKNGISRQWNVSFSNGQSARSNVSVSSSVIANGLEVATGSQSVSCGLALGTLPTGTCSISSTAAYPLNSPYPGFPVGGAVVFKVYLWAGFTLLDSKSYTTTIYDDRPAMTALNPGSGSIFIGGAGKTFTGTILNPPVAGNPALTWGNISARPYISQGSVIRYSTAALINCGSGAGVVPLGTCNFSGTYSISNTSPGTGTLVPGPAGFGMQLVDAAGNIIGGVYVNVTLAAPPTISNVKTSGVLFALAGDKIADTVTIQNPGSTISDAVVVATVSQNGVSNTLPLNCGSGANVLPTGSCTFIGTVLSSATLTPGAANLQIQLSSLANGVLATQTVPITVGVLPTIDDGGLDIPAFQKLVIGDPTPIPYHASLGNAGSSNIPNVMTLKLVVTQQGGSVARTVSTMTVVCSGLTGIPVGACGLAGTLRMNDASEDKGTLTAGGATLEFHLIDVVSGKELATPFQKGVTLQ